MLIELAIERERDRDPGWFASLPPDVQGLLFADWRIRHPKEKA